MTAQLSTGAARRVEIGRITALQAGPATGQPVLLLPGYTGSKEDFGPVLDPLAEYGLQVTAIDLPGQYESPPLQSPADYAPSRLAGELDAVVEQLGGSVHLLGHSFGGLVARAAVIARPRRYRSVVLLSSGPAALGGMRRTRIDELEPLLARAGLPGLYAAMQAGETADPGYVAPPPDLAAFLRQRFLQSSPIMLQGMADALRAEPDLVARLAATGVPALVVHGADDDAWPPKVQREMAQRLAARYEVIPHAAHSAAVENPAALVRVLVDFWLGSAD